MTAFRQLTCGGRYRSEWLAVETRHRLGDWEGDRMHGGRANLVTVVGRKNGFLRAAFVAQRTAGNMAEAIKRLLCHDPCETLALDNGSKFAEHQSVSRRLKIPWYFAEPYASWQRGANENANGLLRQYLPKGCDMRAISTRTLNATVRRISIRPRKRLGWKCPAEVFYGTSVALVS